MAVKQTEREIFSKARIDRNKNFDGRFFFAVKTTGIFCRPSCPSPVANEENVIYVDNIFQAIKLGFKPCQRCRPDLNLEYHNSYIPGSDTVNRTLKLIYEGYLNYHSIEELALEIGKSPRQLRKLFMDCIGIAPVKIGRYHKSVFAKKLLLSSAQTVTEIAFASGFRSIREFNSCYREIFSETPSETRKRGPSNSTDTSIMLKYNLPFDFRQMLAFMKPRLIAGVEQIENDIYFRTFRTKYARGWFSVQDQSDAAALKLTICCDDVRCYMELYYRVRKMFDLDTDFTQINTQLGACPLLQKGMTNAHVPRLPAAFDAFEFVIRAILGQQITVKAATTLAGRIAEKAGLTIPEAPYGLKFFFPDAEELDKLELANIGITKTRQQTIKNITNAVLKGTVNLSGTQKLEKFSKDFNAVKGIGDWTVSYTAMRGLGIKDAFPASDLGIIKAFTENNKRPTIKQIEAAAEKWQPYRSYAALCIWNIPAKTPAKE